MNYLSINLSFNIMVINARGMLRHCYIFGSSFTFFNLDSFLPVITTSIPFFAKFIATAFPIPLDEPVISAN